MAHRWFIERGRLCLAAMLLALTAFLAFGSLTAEAAKPRVAIVGFTSRVQKTDITLTDLKEPLPEILTVAREQLTAELAGEAKFDLYDFGAQSTKARCDEAAFVEALGAGDIVPELAGKADYYVFGYLTTLGKVKAQSGALGLSGRDKTVYAELSLRVMDAHTGAIVFVTKADSRRKAELAYNAVWQRHDSGEEDAIAAALEDAAVNLAAQFKQAM
ncbi:hypothetical protein [uncultured Mitsuokella sp.]|uniref:hypothetical protein n=1 Tax=uncultured Mitsuokella sp. TaxID=453120 RepID=UPI0025971417|nr:hypothetical protein [uncultured Mitsuokella sp.]